MEPEYTEYGSPVPLSAWGHPSHLFYLKAERWRLELKRLNKDPNETDLAAQRRMFMDVQIGRGAKERGLDRLRYDDEMILPARRTRKEEKKKSHLSAVFTVLKLYLVEKKEPKDIARIVARSNSWVWKTLKKAS
jgi:hypothetical protein